MEGTSIYKESILEGMERDEEEVNSSQNQQHSFDGRQSNEDEHAQNEMTEALSGHRYVNMEPFEEEKLLPSRLSNDLDEIEEEDDEPDDDQFDDAQAHQVGTHLDRVHGERAHHNYVNEDHDDPDQNQQLNLLRDLLRVERLNNENNRANNDAMKKYIQQLQMDYLKQQNDLVEALEFSHKLKCQKDSQISSIEQTVRDKDALIEQLRANIENLDEKKLRAEFEANLDKQRQLAKLECDQLNHQIESVEQLLTKEKANVNQLTQQLQEKLEEQRQMHEKELAAVCSRYNQTQLELDRLLTEPQNLVLKALKEEKAAVECRVDDLSINVQEIQSKYDNLKRRLESLMVEQEQAERRNQEEVESLQEHYAEQRRSLSELKLELEDKKEIIQILQFNLQRSEKRVKNLLGVMKNKEETYRDLVAQMEMKHQLEVEKVRNESHLTEKELIVNESDLSKKQNELVKMRLEHENQLESMRNDRDERLNKLSLERQNLERELKATELKLAREIEQAGGRTRLIEQLHKEVKQFRDESKRLSIELTKSEAKLYAKQQELNQSLERLNLQRANSQSQLNDAARLQQVTMELDEERRLSRKLNVNIEELKKENSKLNTKLRIAEANLDRMTTAINREHNKMVREYQKKLDQIRIEQSTFDKSKMRYKRYGYKLKKYCEHLRHVHQHLCNPTVCGYILGPMRAPAATDLSPSSKQTNKQIDNCDKMADQMSLLSNENDSDEDDSYLDDQESNQSNRYSTDDGYGTRKSNQRPTHPVIPERFFVKRTGLSPVLKRTPSSKSRGRPSFRNNNHGARVPLQSRDQNVMNNDGDAMRLTNEHQYYSINEDQSYDAKLHLRNQSPCHRAII